MPNTDHIVRRASSNDLSRLAEIYRNSVESIGNQKYSDEQVAAWSAFADKTELFRDFVLKPMTLVLDQGGIPVAFGGIEPNGHIASLYVHGCAQRSGAGSTILRELEAHAREHEIPVLYAEASQFSKPLFLRMGYAVDREETVQYDDVSFLRWVVVKSLTDCG